MARDNRENIEANKSELLDNVVAIRRVTKVVKGGRNMRFSALVVVGDKNGHVGVGTGKAAEVPEAIRKAKQDAEKHMITVPLDEMCKSQTPPAEVIAIGPPIMMKFCELAGLQNIRTKSLGSNNKQNVVLATIEGLKALKTPEQVAANRGKAVAEL